jgi:hypothetical protein
MLYARGVEMLSNKLRIEPTALSFRRRLVSLHPPLVVLQLILPPALPGVLS